MTRHLFWLGASIVTSLILAGLAARHLSTSDISSGEALTSEEHPWTGASPPRPAPARQQARATPTHASRSRHLSVVDRLDVTAYCHTGNPTASGVWPREGMAAGNRWPFGTVLRVPGWGQVTITDRIGMGSDLDLYMGSCSKARRWGRKHLPVEVLR